MAVRDNKRVVCFLSSWLPVLFCMAIIFYFSSMPGKDIPSLFPLQDILFHGSIYGILALFFYRALKNTLITVSVFHLIVFSIIFCTTYGISDELHQLFVPGRDCSALDLLVDGAGSLVGSLIGGYFVK